jgi:magnesium-transporting ATPase (P-type)
MSDPTALWLGLEVLSLFLLHALLNSGMFVSWYRRKVEEIPEATGFKDRMIKGWVIITGFLLSAFSFLTITGVIYLSLDYAYVYHGEHGFEVSIAVLIIWLLLEMLGCLKSMKLQSQSLSGLLSS